MNKIYYVNRLQVMPMNYFLCKLILKFRSMASRMKINLSGWINNTSYFFFFLQFSLR